MASEHSFDIVSRIDLQELRNAVAQALKEIRQRFDFKGSKADIRLLETEHRLEIDAEDDMKLRNAADVLRAKLVKRGVPLAGLDFAAPQPIGGSMRRQAVAMQQGIPIDGAREIVKLIKGTKRKVQAAIQADQVRVTGKSLDDLQAVMAMLREAKLGIDMQFVNYR